MTGTRTVTAYGADNISINGLTKGPRAGWAWDGQALSHPVGTRILLTAGAAARVSAAVAAYRPMRSLTGYQVSQLPEGDRDGWEFSHVANEVHGIYTKGHSTPGRTELTAADVVSMTNRAS